MREEFSRQFAVPASADAIWRTITDVRQLVGWLSVLQDAETLEQLSHYRAVLMDRVGRFSMRADLDIRVTEVNVPTRLVATAEGEDRQMGSRILVNLNLDLGEQDGFSQLSISGAYEVTGRVATLGSSTIRRKAGKILEEFFANLNDALT